MKINVYNNLISVFFFAALVGCFQSQPNALENTLSEIRKIRNVSDPEEWTAGLKLAADLFDFAEKNDLSTKERNAFKHGLIHLFKVGDAHFRVMLCDELWKPCASARPEVQEITGDVLVELLLEEDLLESPKILALLQVCNEMEESEMRKLYPQFGPWTQSALENHFQGFSETE